MAEIRGLSLGGENMTFQTNGGPVELWRAAEGERGQSIGNVLEAVNVLMNAGLTVPRAFTLTPADYDYLMSMTTTEIRPRVRTG